MMSSSAEHIIFISFEYFILDVILKDVKSFIFFIVISSILRVHEV